MRVPAIHVRDLSFRYAGAAAPVLRNLDWEVPEGAFALLVGDTGSGKSTLLSLLKPEIAPAGERTGALEVQGSSVDALDPVRAARTVGFVFQRPENQIVCESVWHEMAFGLENLGTSQDEMRRRIAETSYFLGIDGWFREDTATLSGGRKQLLALASTLAMGPRILLLDEPTAQLDPVAEKNFLHALFRINRELGCTVVVATHRPRAMVEYATCAYRLASGQLAPVGDLASLSCRQSLEVPASASAPSAPTTASLSRVWFRYGRDADWVLRGLDLTVRAGRLHALVGGNGCGKSTLLALLAGARKPVRGTARVTVRIRALLPQDPRALFVAETVEEELREWRAAGYGAAEVRAMLARIGLADAANRHPYDLSGGQQQLLALAKLMLLKPELLLLDEPTKGLDLEARRVVARLITEALDAGAAVVMATHDLDLVQQAADEVSMVFDGEIASTASSEEFFRGNVYYRP